MERSKAIELLEQELAEIACLRELPCNNDGDNEKFKLWRYKVLDIIEAAFGKDSSEYRRIPIMPIKTLTFEKTEAERKQEYNEYLDRYEVALKSIIRKYELLGIETKQSIEVLPEEIFREVPPKAFISHGKESAALRKLKEFIETLGIEPLIVKKAASLDKDVPDKVNLYLTQADFVIILATGDDVFEGKRHPRQNVIHEIGLAQKTQPGRIIYLLEEGTEFPSNIRPKVWESFKQRNMMDAFLGIIRELRAYGILKVTKFPIEEQKS